MSAARVARAALVLAVATALALAAFVLALPRLAERPELRRHAEDAAQRALGRRVGYESLSLQLFPPALVLERPWIAGAHEGGERLLEADRLALELAIRPLLERRAVARSIEIDRPVLNLARDADGLGLPALPGAGGSAGGSFGARRVTLVRGTLVLRDAAVSPPVTSELRDLELELAAAQDGTGVAAQGSFAVGAGGVRLSGLEVASGAQARVAFEGKPGALRGSIAIDAGAAALRLADLLAKPAGVPARFAARVEIGAGRAIAVRDARLEIAGLVAEGAGSLVADRLALDLRTGSLPAAALAALVPQLAEIPGLGGALALRSLHLETDPLVVLADVALDDLVLSPGTPAPLRVRGPVALRGRVARAEGLAVAVGGQPMTVDGEVRLGDAPTYSLSGRLRGADARAFLAGVLPRAPRIDGRLDLDAELRGPLDANSLVDTAEGALRVHIADGRIAGVSVLESALEALSALERLSGLSRILGTGGADAASAEGAGDRFRTLDATVQQAQGVSRTDDLRIVYPTYHLALSGEMRASEATVAMQGDILLAEGLVGPIGKALGVVGLGCAAPNRIPVPEISGPVSDLRVRPDAAYLVGFATRCNPVDPLKSLGKGLLGVPRSAADALGRGRSEQPDPGASPPPATQTPH